MNDKDKNKDNTNEKKSAGQILPDDKKHLKDKMADHVKSPLINQKDKGEVTTDSKN